VVEQGFVGMACHPERFPEEILRAYRQNALRPGAAKAMIDYYRAFLCGGGARRQSALGHPAIDVRTLVVWGERDRALGRETCEGTDAFVPDLTLRFLPDASHWVQQDEPEVVNAMLRAWLEHAPVPEAPAAL
jgi:pimeloyl-ACP methyl ester carboxylesterase